MISIHLFHLFILRTFAAICALFGNYQQQKLGYPIGLIESSWGGTFIEPWSTPEGLETCEIPPDHQNQDQAKNNHLFNAMIHPLMKFSIEGAIWYQGENNGKIIFLCFGFSSITLQKMLYYEHFNNLIIPLSKLRNQ